MRHGNMAIPSGLLMIFLTGAGPLLGAATNAAPASSSASGSVAPDSWLAQVQHNLEEQEYDVSWQASPQADGIKPSWQAPNRSQGFRTYFTPEGIRMVPTVDRGSDWRFGLTLAGYGQGDTTWPVPQSTLTPAGHRIEYRRGALEERYENTPSGLEQIFVLPEPAKHEKEFEQGSPGLIHIDLALWGNLSPRIAEDGQAIDFMTSTGTPVLHYAQLKATDARGVILPARMEGLASGNVRGIRLVIDARAGVYPITVDPLATSAAWTAESDQAASRFGASVATAGDVNGDGYSDVIIGAYGFDNGETDEGRVFVYLGSASGLATSPAWTVESNQAGAQFGRAVASAGDVNGDGYADVIVGALDFDNGETDEGRAFVYLGSAAGLATTPAWTAESDLPNSLFGFSVATAGDVNGDGYADVIVGAYFYGGGVGRVYVFLGSAAGLGIGPAWTVDSPQGFASFGSSVASAGDVNGDGYADVIVGAYKFANGQTDEGRAFVYLGSASGLAVSPAWTAESNQASAGFGYSVATAGDVNGDGYSDVIVGAFRYDNGQEDEGRVYLYLGSASGLAASPAWTAESDQAFANFGNSVATAGDVNGDGYADVIIGAYAYSNGQTFEGRAYVYLGSIAGLGGVAWTTESNQANADLGDSVATAGDVNGDGYSDVLVGATFYDNGQTDEGRAYLYLGSVSSPFQEVELGSGLPLDTFQANAYFGSSVGGAGDVNGDGYSDLIVGSPGYDNGQVDEGQVYVYLGPDIGQGLVPSPAWTVESNQAGANFGASVATAGDVNGDGYSDVLVGAPYFSNGQVHEGRAYLYLGSASGLAAAPAWTAESDQANANFGWAVSTAGDVNGDGYSDVLVSAPYYDNGQLNEGRAYLYLGSPAGLSATPAWTAESDQADANFGLSIGTAGDVDGDGYSDVIVGAPNFDNVEIDEGRAYVYLGSPGGLAPSPIWTVSAHHLAFPEASAYCGSSVATAGDVNGDGYSDVIVGAEGSETGPGAAGGRAYVYLGSASGLATDFAWVADPSQHNARFGASVATAGDVNGDGYSDVIIGAPAFDLFTPDNGRAYLYLGSASGLALTPAWSSGYYAFSVDSNVGASVACAGDFDGDGYSDFIVGGPGYDLNTLDAGGAFFYPVFGPGRIIDRIPRQARSTAPALVGLLGKSDSETAFNLQERARIASGRGKVRLQWEVKPLGTPFNGIGVGASPVQDTGAPDPLGPYYGSATDISQQVTGLVEGTFYHWRSRIVTADPLFPHSPWASLGGNSMTETKLRTAGCIDRDGDGYGALGDASCLGLVPDCSDSSAGVWDTPGETLALGFTSNTALTWSPPATGALPSALVYDTLRSIAAGDFLSPSTVCVESDNGPDTTATDSAVPALGQVFFYLTRAQDACPIGQGSLGTSSSGAQRQGRTCP